VTPGRACVLVQCTHTDLLDSAFRPGRATATDPHDPDLYAAGPLRAADLGPVVLTAPDTAPNRDLIPALAERWGVRAHLGDEHDVVARLIAAARGVGAERLARVVLPSFYVDPALVARQLAQLAAVGADYCALPRDFNVNFGADVCTVAALEDAGALAERVAPPLRGLLRYRPWPFLEQAGDGVRVTVCTELPERSEAELAAIRRHPTWPERAGPGIQGGEYEALAAELLSPSDRVLDAGCGHGEISAILARHCRRVVGVDYDPAMIALARGRVPGVEFHAADLQTWTTAERFDVIVHAHTLEHLPDPLGALANLRGLLAPGGRLAVEVPLLVRPGIVNPHHEREYTVELLRTQLDAGGFEIVEERGVARGVYGRPEQAREAYLAIAVAGRAA